MRPGTRLPDTLFLVVNSRCNLRCRMCDIGQRNADGQFHRVMDRGGDLLLPEEIYALLAETSSWQPKIAITGTEPLLYPYLEEVTSRILSSGRRLQITTNGFLLPDFAAFFVNAGLTELWVSIDGPRRVHDLIRGVEGAYDKAVEGLRRVVRAAENSGKPGPRLALNCTISHLNQRELVPFVREFQKENIPLDRVTFCHTNFVTAETAMRHNAEWGSLYPAYPSCTSGFNPLEVDPDLLWPQIRECREMAPWPISFSPELDSKEKVGAYYHLPDSFVTRPSCGMSRTSAQILSDATLTVSTRCLDISLGNLRQAPFMELWEGPKRKKFLDDLQQAGAFPACSRCCGAFSG
jgi:Fe-coproporphyrin III synthase